MPPRGVPIPLWWVRWTSNWLLLLLCSQYISFCFCLSTDSYCAHILKIRGPQNMAANICPIKLFPTFWMLIIYFLCYALYIHIGCWCRWGLPHWTHGFLNRLHLFNVSFISGSCAWDFSSWCWFQLEKGSTINQHDSCSWCSYGKWEGK